MEERTATELRIDNIMSKLIHAPLTILYFYIESFSITGLCGDRPVTNRTEAPGVTVRSSHRSVSTGLSPYFYLVQSSP